MFEPIGHCCYIGQNQYIELGQLIDFDYNMPSPHFVVGLRSIKAFKAFGKASVIGRWSSFQP